MKISLLVILGFLLLQTAFSQSSLPPFQQNKNLPAFEIQKTDNRLFTNTNLKKNMPVIIMFFSPGCDHCIHQFEDITKRMNEMKKYQIVMATYQPIEELAEFDKKYKISQYPNITTGRDTKYFFPPFFQLNNFPFMAYYDSNGKLKGSSEGNIKIEDMLKKFK